MFDRKGVREAAWIALTVLSALADIERWFDYHSPRGTDTRNGVGMSSATGVNVR